MVRSHPNLTGGPFDAAGQAGILDYCMADVMATSALLRAMEQRLPVNLDQALFRSRYTVAGRYGSARDSNGPGTVGATASGAGNDPTSVGGMG
jgi:hypothetical protein